MVFSSKIFAPTDVAGHLVSQHLSGVEGREGAGTKAYPNSRAETRFCRFGHEKNRSRANPWDRAIQEWPIHCPEKCSRECSASGQRQTRERTFGEWLRGPP